MSCAATTNQRAWSAATIHRQQPINVGAAAAADAVVLVTANMRHHDVTTSDAHGHA